MWARWVIAGVAASASAASADLIFDIPDWSQVGSGEHTAYVVIDFTATNYPVYAWSYSWDGDASVHDMLLAIEADAGLMYDWTDWGSGIFVNNFAYGSPAGDPDLYWSHALGTVQGNGPDWSDAVAGTDLTPITNGMISGWYNGFNEDFSAIPPDLTSVLVPAPSALVALLLGCSMGRQRRR
ncbi:MAG: hypothetical protein QF733_04545 [Phycisphaerales bacterium]|jgi:hypothetical protein|nr:hypothetical protein [Phycisphaerales bacterium]